MVWLVDGSLGLPQYAGSSVSQRGPQYDMALNLYSISGLRCLGGQSISGALKL